MSEELLSKLRVLSVDATDLVCNLVSEGGWVEGQRGTGRPVRHEPCPALPKIEPGQLWLVEFPAGNSETFPLEYSALSGANVVIYDRALAPAVARFLPLGAYAEPAAQDSFYETNFQRCLGFAREGWSVARLVRPGGGAVHELRRLTRALLSRGAPANLPVVVFVNVSGGFEKTEFQLGRVDLGYFESSRLATIVIGAIAEEDAPNLSAPSTNGLAG